VEARPLIIVLLTAVLTWASPAAAEQSLEQRIPDLFGGVLFTSVTQFVEGDGPDVQAPSVAARFRGLSAALSAARAQLPVPSASGAFQFEWDRELDTFVRRRQSLGPSLAERAQTLGTGMVTLNFSYSHIDFSTLEGDRLGRLRSAQPALSDAFLSQLPLENRRRAMDNVLQTTLDFAFTYDLFFLTAAYGLTDDIDLSLGLSINRARMSARADGVIIDQNGDEGAYFIEEQPFRVMNGTGVCSNEFLCVHDRFSDSAFGTGDIFLRGKWNFYNGPIADLATAAILTLPTGNAEDLLGFHHATFTPWLIASNTFGPISPHVNLGYAFRDGDDVSQAQWIAGADVQVFPWLTLAGEFLGFHDDKRDNINDDIIQSAIGFKINPFGQFVIGGSFQFPVNRDGLRADVIYTLQLESAF
jgi:hypothetical protein